MIRIAACAVLTCAVIFAVSQSASARDVNVSLATDSNGNLQSLIARHAAATGVPESLIRRVIHRESRGNPRVISKGNYGLMQIRLGTARAMGYRGSVEGLLDADTNMTYAVKYLAGALRVAGGNHDRAVAYYAGGYYYAARRKGMDPWSGGDRAAVGVASNDVATASGVTVSAPQP